jgi:hypothetical protein
LQGATLQVDTVPVYLQGLAHERALAGTRFDDFVIERPRAEASAEKTEPASAEKHIRFRAGSKALTATATEATT